MTVTIQLAGQPVSRLEGDSHSVGSDSRCAIQVAGPGVAPRHALLRRVAGRWLIEAAGDQLIRIGDGRPTKLAWLNPGDQIYISTDGPPFVFEPVETKALPLPLGLPAASPRRAPAIPTAPREDSPQHPASQATSADQRQPFWFAVGGAGLLAAGILLTVLILGLTGAFHRAPAAPGEVNPASPSESSSAPVASTADSNPEQKDSPDNAVAAVAEPQAPGDISRAIYIVQVETDEDHQRYRLGTAWAISPQKLITSGAVAAGVQALRKVASTARVVSADGKRSLTVRSIRLHPGYESAMKEAGEAQSEAEGLRLELEQRSANVDSLTEQLITAEEKRYQAYERQTGVDLALLEVDGAMPHSLPVAKSSERPLKLGSRMRLAGFPFEEEDFIVDPDHSSSLETRDATVGTAPHGHTAGPAYWRIRTGADLGSDNWSGSPVIDSTGGVVGVYSRPTPPPPGRPPPETWILHDVADAEGLTALGENRP